MNTILDQIVRTTREQLSHKKQRVPLVVLKDSPYFNSPTLSLRAALREQKRPAIIAELKKASPSRGVIRASFNVVEIARQYKLNGAAALSVLTEPVYFQGALDYLVKVRQTVDLPLLRKDFIVDPYQLYEARAAGADAVLLIATLLEAAQLHDLYDEAHALGLECLVEVYHEQELEALDISRLEIIGVNNRDLRTFTVDLHRGVAMLKHLPDNLVKVAESGLQTPEDLRYLREHGIDGALIGEAFMRAPEPGVALRHMIQQSMTVGETQPLRLVS